jgi:replicative DNA helicase
LLVLDANYSGNDVIADYIDVIKCASIKRQIDQLCNKITTNEWPFTEFDQNLTKFYSEFNEIIWNNNRKYNDLISPNEAINQLEKMRNRNSDKICNVVPIGIKTVDDMLHEGGMNKGGVYVLAAPPGTGKTAFALNVIQHESELLLSEDYTNRKTPIILLFSLEMTVIELAQRMISLIANKPFKDLDSSNNEFDKQRFNTAKKIFSSYPLKIFPGQDINVMEVRKNINIISKSNDLKLVIIDHLHIMSGTSPKQNEYEKISEITNMIRQIAKDYNIPILLLCQLDKSATKTGTTEQITMANLRGSGTIAQDANSIFILQEKNKQSDENKTESRFITFKIEKQRAGKKGSVQLHFYGPTYKFTQIQEKTN